MRLQREKLVRLLPDQEVDASRSMRFIRATAALRKVRVFIDALVAHMASLATPRGEGRLGAVTAAVVKLARGLSVQALLQLADGG